MTRTKLSEYLHAHEDKAVALSLETLPWDQKRSESIEEKASAMVKALRKKGPPMGQLEAFMKDYSLETEEGLALMCLAEALLRVPDKKTANALIRDKVEAANWLDAAGGSKDWIVKAAGVGLFVSSKTLDGVLSRLGEPFIREAMIQAMQVLGKQFVLGTDIENAVQNANKFRKKGYRMSYDVLGEAARTAADAQRYFDAYLHAINYIGERGSKDEQRRPGISVKLSAFHPRYEYAQKERCVPEIREKLKQLALAAQQHNIAFTIDAEEADRLELSLDIIEGLLPDLDPSWEGFGVVVQAYQKRALPLIDHLAALSQKHHRRMQVRLVKGAYWDSEIKQAHEEGLEAFPVFTRKTNTDVSYLACAHKLLSYDREFYPMFATHNAHSLAAVIEMAEGREFECQRLFGMGSGLFDNVMKEYDIPASIYAPVGPHQELLPYLVRRLLENGANSSFVNRLLDPDAPVEGLVADPVEKIRGRTTHMHPKICLPKEIYENEDAAPRVNSMGMDLSDPVTVKALYDGMSEFSDNQYEAAPIINGKPQKDGISKEVLNPADHSDVVGTVWSARSDVPEAAIDSAKEAFVEWSGTDADIRAQILERIADLYEENQYELMSLAIREAGKTIPDAIAEIREAIDFCRYYANRGRRDFQTGGFEMPGVTGESNRYSLHGRGVFICISPWNFPMAIYTGQVVAALVSGNCVVCKPAEQTPLIAAKCASLMYEAGIPQNVLHIVTGEGDVGAALVAHKDVRGVCFTGSTEVAREINRTLAAKDGPIVPLIAETGGQNAMIVDSSALPEQVIDDVVSSAFGSAGQRCSAMRIVCIQEDVADKMIRMLKGAMAELVVGMPEELSTDVGPVIDEDARGILVSHREALKGFGKFIYEAKLDPNLREKGSYFAPCAYEIDTIDALKNEVFGPILHVVRFEKNKLGDLLEDIDESGYALTFGVHSRIDEFQDYVVSRVRAGNAYVNRSMTGAIVGSQPFGGHGLSGTGPKAGGPYYLHRFATERVVSTDTTATGGNASLVSLEE
ncbi:MAG: bifunctional proline dehydrogenase/L-glutamate gamma-semialdehyde dehydrogenase PutA [Alphaproteobacteria bacterium]|nr:bifunctional proline dehydrogenase/L-glutamate gamma-semialdehyde dehydrogenase PutA [Alphaproteobacteria bacterium]